MYLVDDLCLIWSQTRILIPVKKDAGCSLGVPSALHPLENEQTPCKVGNGDMGVG